MGTAEGAALGVSVDWKRNSITNNSYSRSVLCGAGHSRALACRGRAGGRQRAVSKRVKSKFGGAVRMASARRPGGVRACPPPWNTMQQPFLRIPRNVSGRDFAVGDVHGHFPPASEPGSVGFRSGARPAVLGGRRWTGAGERTGAGLAAAAWFHAVQGNHEDYAIHHVRSGKVDQMNCGYGGGWFLDLPEERQREYAQAFEALPVAIEVETRDGAVGLVHADCPVLFWPRRKSAARPPRTSAVCQWSRDRLRGGSRRRARRARGGGRAYARG